MSPHHLYSRLRALVRWKRQEAELDEEIRFHLSEEADERADDGLSAHDARVSARKSLGSVALVRENTRESWGWGSAERLIQDLRYAMRVFVRTPRFTIPAVIALALGIGATSAIFSVARGVMLKPLPYREPERIVGIWERRLDRDTRNVIASANFVAWRERTTSFDHLGMVGPSQLNIVLDGQPEEIRGFMASSDALAAFGTPPQLGRIYTPEEDLEGQDGVIVVSHQFWQSRLGGRSDILGQTMTANGRSRSVIGVMPSDFTIDGQPAAYMIPYGWTLQRLRDSPGRGSSHGVARLRDGVSFERASAEMLQIAEQLRTEVPRRNANWSVTLMPIHEQMVDQIRPALYLLAGAVLLVLLIACVNVSNLLVARATARQRELGLRTALGAGRGRLIRQLLTESLLLSLAGGATGLVLAVVFHAGLLALVADRIPVPRLEQVSLDVPVLLFTLALSLCTAIVFGVLPAVFATGNAGEGLREGGRHGGSPRARRVLGTLVVAEVALSLVLLAGAGLLIRSFVALQRVSPGMQTGGVLTARVSVSGARYSDNDRAGVDFYDRAVAGIARIPGVQSAAGVSFLPMAGPGIGTSFNRVDRPTPAPGQFPSTDVRPVTPAFFRTMGIPQRAGRDFTAADTADSPPVAIVNETMVRDQFPNEDPIGKRISVNIGSTPRPNGVEIVGVVGDVKMASLEGAVRPTVYMPHTQLPIGLMTFVMRTPLEPTSLTRSVAAAVREVDPALPLADVRTMDEVVAATLARPRAVSTLLTAFALIALVLAGVGVYGVMAYSVSQRTQEIGVRMALGATAVSVFRMMIGQSLRLVIAGVVVGTIAAAWLSRFLTTMLFEIGQFDAWTFTATALILGLVATLASYVPARRGTRIVPLEALRAE